MFTIIILYCTDESSVVTLYILVSSLSVVALLLLTIIIAVCYFFHLKEIDQNQNIVQNGEDEVIPHGNNQEGTSMYE